MEPLKSRMYARQRSQVADARKGGIGDRTGHRPQSSIPLLLAFLKEPEPWVQTRPVNRTLIFYACSVTKALMSALATKPCSVDGCLTTHLRCNLDALIPGRVPHARRLRRAWVEQDRAKPFQRFLLDTR